MKRKFENSGYLFPFLSITTNFSQNEGNFLSLEIIIYFTLNHSCYSIKNVKNIVLNLANFVKSNQWRTPLLLVLLHMTTFFLQV